MPNRNKLVKRPQARSSPSRPFPQPIHFRVPPQYLQHAHDVAAKLGKNQQVQYVLRSIKKSLHHGGMKYLSPDEEQQVFDQVSQSLASSPSVLEEIAKLQNQQIL